MFWNLRIKLEIHREILIKYNIIIGSEFGNAGSYEEFTTMNNPFQLLKYLNEHILHTKCFNNFQLFTIIPNHHKDLNLHHNLN